jgi:hypothetical protein
MSNNAKTRKTNYRALLWPWHNPERGGESVTSWWDWYRRGSCPGAKLSGTDLFLSNEEGWVPVDIE